MTTYLLDSNALIALTTADHVHHDAAWRWFELTAPDVATCPITEGALVRHQVRNGVPASQAIVHLDMLRRNHWHHFWADDIGFDASTLTGVIGHRQVTDAYLTALAAKHAGQLATLDRGLATLRPEVTLIES